MPSTEQLEAQWQANSPRPETVGGWLFRGLDANGQPVHHVVTGAAIDWAAMAPILAAWREYAEKPLPVGSPLLG